MPVTINVNLVRPQRTINDLITPGVYNGDTVKSATVDIDGALATDGSAPQTGTQTGDWKVAGNGEYGGTLSVTGETTLSTLRVTTAIKGPNDNLAVQGTLTAGNIAGTNQGGVIKTVFNDHLFIAAGKKLYGDIETNTLTVGTIGGTTQGGVVKTVFADFVFISAGKKLYGDVESENLRVKTSFSVDQTVIAQLKGGFSVAAGPNFLNMYPNTATTYTITLAAGAVQSLNVTTGGFTGACNRVLVSTDHDGLLASAYPGDTNGVIVVKLRNVSGAAISGVAVKISLFAFRS